MKPLDGRLNPLCPLLLLFGYYYWEFELAVDDVDVFPRSNLLSGVDTSFIWGMVRILKFVFGISIVKCTSTSSIESLPFSTLPSLLYSFNRTLEKSNGQMFIV